MRQITRVTVLLTLGELLWRLKKLGSGSRQGATILSATIALYSRCWGMALGSYFSPGCSLAFMWGVREIKTFRVTELWSIHGRKKLDLPLLFMCSWDSSEYIYIYPKTWVRSKLSVHVFLEFLRIIILKMCPKTQVRSKLCVSVYGEEIGGLHEKEPGGCWVGPSIRFQNRS